MRHDGELSPRAGRRGRRLSADNRKTPTEVSASPLGLQYPEIRTVLAIHIKAYRFPE